MNFCILYQKKTVKEKEEYSISLSRFVDCMIVVDCNLPGIEVNFQVSIEGKNFLVLNPVQLKSSLLILLTTAIGHSN